MLPALDNSRVVKKTVSPPNHFHDKKTLAFTKIFVGSPMQLCDLKLYVMKKNILNIMSRAFVLLSAFSFLYVSGMAFIDPQQVMNLVQVQLPNNDAYSSIRGVYGGVGLALVVTLLYLLRKNLREALALLSLVWGLYALSRLITIFKEGALGDFGMQWLFTESLFFAVAMGLWFATKPRASVQAGKGAATINAEVGVG